MLGPPPMLWFCVRLGTESGTSTLAEPWDTFKRQTSRPGSPGPSDPQPEAPVPSRAHQSFTTGSRLPSRLPHSPLAWQAMLWPIKLNPIT